MSDILNKIVAVKHEEVAAAKKRNGSKAQARASTTDADR